MIMEYILIFISAIFVNNIVFSQFLGICPFLGVSKKVETALGMSAAVAFVLTIATIVTFLIQKSVLDAFDLGYFCYDLVFQRKKPVKHLVFLQWDAVQRRSAKGISILYSGSRSY